MNDSIVKIENKIEDSIKKWHMLPDGCSVVAGLSGGADSLMLTHFLWRYSKEHNIDLTAAHVNHMLRGEEADRDERFVISWCGEHGIRIKVLHANVRAEAAKNSEGLEECGRNIRYSFFRSICGKCGRIATAHTLSDSAETVLMNLAKGTGPRGLCGIPPVRGNIVRPLIGVTRDEVECYCKYYKLDYVTDSTNLEDDYGRNKIRHNVVPVLKRINTGFEQALGRTQKLMRLDEEYLEDKAGKLLLNAKNEYGYDVSALRSEGFPILSRAVARAIENAGDSRLDFMHIDAVLKIIIAGNGSLTVPGGIQCAVHGNTLFVTPKRVKTITKWEVPLEIPETRLPDGRIFSVRKINYDILKNKNKFNNLSFNNLLNYDTILTIGSLVRSRLNGDVFRPAGRGVTKKVKKLFNEAKIPPLMRDRIAVLECGGKIVWIEGFGASQEARVTDETTDAAQIIIKECN